MNSSPPRSGESYFDANPGDSPTYERARSSSSASSRPSYSRSSSFASLMPMMDRYGEEWGSGATTLIDVVETFFDSRLDLMGRRLKEQSARLKTRTLELIPKGLRTPGGGGSIILDDLPSRQSEGDGLDVSESRESRDLRERRGEKYRKEVEREVERIKVKLAAKVTHLSGTWRSAQIVRTREKFSFFFGVLSLAFTCILYGASPEWLPLAYTVQSAFYLPTRVWSYKRKAFHYFLFDLCYFVNVLDLIWIWLFPQSTVLFICCYLLTMGPLASAIITWRNSLVFHSMDKVTSLFIHMYPPLVLTVIRHSYVNAEARYPGLAHVSDYSWWKQILLAGVPYILWQAAYYKFISIDRKSKIESGQRQNSFHYLLNDKRGPIGKALKGINPTNRERWFIFGQLIYSIVFMIPAAALYIHSTTASGIYLTVVFGTSVWNGGNFYIEVFGRKFERELEKLRREMELASATNAPSSTHSTSAPSTPYVDGQSGYQTDGGDELANSPLALPGAGPATELEVPDLTLDRAVEEIDKEDKKSR